MDLALLDRARELGSQESGLAVVVTTRADGSAHASVVNAGIVSHPVTKERTVGFVAQGGGQTKLRHLRARPQATVVFRSGWDWVAIEGDVDLVGPDDVLEGLALDDTTRVFHEIYAAAIGGRPEDWTERDSLIEEQGHAAVLVHPKRIYARRAPD